jgi:hypothetical protein
MGLDAILVLFFFLLPGMIADACFRFLLWRPETKGESRAVRAAVFSAGGLFVLFLVGTLVTIIPPEFTVPVYLFPEWWSATRAADIALLGQTFRSWGIHVAASLLLCLVLVWALSWKFTAKLIRLISRQSLFETAWAEFAYRFHGKWVLVRTRGGRQHYGELGIAGQGDRSIVLWNPAEYGVVDGEEVIEVSGRWGVYLPESEIAELIVSHSQAERAANAAAMGRYSLNTGERHGDQG